MEAQYGRLEEDMLSATEFLTHMYDPVVPIEDLVDYREQPLEKTIYYWRKHELIPFLPKGKHKLLRFSCLEILWFSVLDQLRKFSFPVDRVRRVREYFFDDALKVALAEVNVRKSVRQLEKLERAGTLGKDDKALLKHGRFLLAEPGRIAPFYGDINYFSLLIRNCLKEGLEMGILIFFDGRVGEFDGYGWSTHHTGVRVDPRESHIYLSIPYLLQPFIDRDVLEQIVMPRRLEKQEVKLLEHIRTKEVRDVSLKLRDGVITRIDVTRPGDFTTEQRRALVDLLRLSGFERLMIDINDPDNMRIDSTKKHLYK